jgi:hypothetical protein
VPREISNLGCAKADLVGRLNGDIRLMGHPQQNDVHVRRVRLELCEGRAVGGCPAHFQEEPIVDGLHDRTAQNSSPDDSMGLASTGNELADATLRGPEWRWRRSTIRFAVSRSVSSKRQWLDMNSRSGGNRY